MEYVPGTAIPVQKKSRGRGNPKRDSFMGDLARPMINVDEHTLIAIREALSTHKQLNEEQLINEAVKSLKGGESQWLDWVTWRVASFLRSGFITADGKGRLKWHDWPVDVPSWKPTRNPAGSNPKGSEVKARYTWYKGKGKEGWIAYLYDKAPRGRGLEGAYLGSGPVEATKQKARDAALKIINKRSNPAGVSKAALKKAGFNKHSSAIMRYLLKDRGKRGTAASLITVRSKNNITKIHNALLTGKPIPAAAEEWLYEMGRNSGSLGKHVKSLKRIVEQSSNKNNPEGWSRHDPEYSARRTTQSRMRRGYDAAPVYDTPYVPSASDKRLQLARSKKFQNKDGSPNKRKIDWFIGLLKEKGEVRGNPQEFTSAGTSLKQVPMLHKKITGLIGPTNVDLGGGKYDIATEYLNSHGIDSHVHDIFWRTPEWNDNVERWAIQRGGTDTVIVSNVLNVIKEKESRADLIDQAARYVKPDGVVYFSVYEGSTKDQNRGPRATGGNKWQNFKPTKWYISEIKKSFASVHPMKGASKILVASGPKAALRNPRKSRSGRKKAKTKPVKIPVGKRNGSVFTSGGKRYTVISYKSNSGKRVRYAREV